MTAILAIHAPLGMDITLFIQTLIDALSLGSIYALFALSIALVFGVFRLINLAQGELIMVAGYTVFVLADTPWPLFVIAALCASVVLALLMERVAFRPVRIAGSETMMITSFAVSYLLVNLAILIMGSPAKTVSISTAFTESFVVGSFRIPKINLLTIAITACLLIALGVMLRRSLMGLQMRGASEDFEMARLLGVRANSVIAAAFGIGGGLAGVVAILLVAQTGTVFPTLGLAPLLVGVVAAVVGGLSSLLGAVVGGYLLGLLTVALQTWLPENLRVYRDAFVFGLVIVILLVRPQGLIPGRFSEQRV
jgi:branched-chain amino acid transport system permease protein